MKGSLTSTTRWTLALALACGTLLVPARSRAEGKVVKIAVLDVRATGVFDPKSVAALSSFIASEVARYPVKVIAGSDLATLIGFEKQKVLLGCSEGSCLAELGGALGVEYLVSSEVGEVGGVWLLTVTLLDATKGSASQRVTKRSRSQADLVDLAAASVVEIAKAVPAFNAASVEPKKPEPTKAVEAQPNAIKAQPPTEPAATASASTGMPGMKIAGWALLGGGAAVVVGGAVAGGLALRRFNDAKANGVDASQLADTRNSISKMMVASDVLYVVGGVAAATGLVLVLVSPSSSDAASGAKTAQASLGFAPVAGGGALLLSGGF